MIGWIIQVGILSFIFIYLVHHLLNFFKNMLTVPKVKDLVDSSNKKYEDIFATLNGSKSFSNTINNNSNNGFTDIDLLPSNSNSNSNNSTSNMKDELKSFLKKQLNSDNNSQNNNSPDFFNPSGSSNMFSNF